MLKLQLREEIIKDYDGKIYKVYTEEYSIILYNNI